MIGTILNLAGQPKSTWIPGRGCGAAQLKWTVGDRGSRDLMSGVNTSIIQSCCDRVKRYAQLNLDLPVCLKNLPRRSVPRATAGTSRSARPTDAVYLLKRDRAIYRKNLARRPGLCTTDRDTKFICRLKSVSLRSPMDSPGAWDPDIVVQLECTIKYL